MSLARILGLLAVLVAVGLLIAAPTMLRSYGVYLLALWSVTTIAALGLNLTLGYAGQISLAQGAFVGIGAYTVALATAAGVPYFVAFLGAGLITFAVGWCLGYPALRVQHHFLAFVTLAFSTLVFLVLRNEQWLTNGIYGINDIARPKVFGLSTNRNPDFYYFALGMLALFAGLQWWMLRSPWGRAFVAIRENPLRAASLGIDVRRYTLMAFAIGSAYGGFAGALYAPLVQFIEPNSFQLTYSLKLLLIVLVGGAGYFIGPFFGAMIEILLPEWLRFTQGYYLLIYATLVVLLMAFCPKGLVGAVALIAERRRKPPGRAAGPGGTLGPGGAASGPAGPAGAAPASPSR
ncbi:branched-chain amino acid ABC transporter permease [Prosthecomicrobium hirschii]|uniref:branched-chain amino acid ABC transporter permease n=1 Tax=Prosthecodimorpha hirschii TaxID=665126 RepID=UPI0009F8B065|nr:branched-chain amino acid ABC transporter permease [Prosthecomicrobium hirschii]TPQ51031.1 branched-chain amino acid ABC transporter permease [Prosthecomicrobium hirschii]